MITRVNGTFLIQWQEQPDGSGAFYGRASSTAAWQTLDQFTLTNDGTYEFDVSVTGIGAAATRFISITQGDGPKIGMKLVSSNDAGNPVIAKSIKLGHEHVVWLPAVLGAKDPKFPVAWGKGTTQAKVVAHWDGNSWAISINGTMQSISSSDSYPVDTTDSIEISVKDGSNPKHWAAMCLCPSADANVTTIVHESNLAEQSNHSSSVTFQRPADSPSSTLYGLNLYTVLEKSDTLSVLA
jgi:hypothetical protein